MLSCAQLDACLTVEALNNTDTVVSVFLSVSKGDKRMSAFSVHVFAETQNRRKWIFCEETNHCFSSNFLRTSDFFV